jgi:hypothetical protein
MSTPSTFAASPNKLSLSMPEAAGWNRKAPLGATQRA